MKHTIKTIGLFLLAFTVLFSSCTKEEIQEIQKGKVGISYKDISKLKADYDVAAILISLVKPDGTEIYNNKRIELYDFGYEYVSEELELETGDYMITQFLVIDHEGNIVYAAPQWGSEQAEFVYQPLPINFTVYKNSYVQIAPEVIDINNCNCEASSFGYAAFRFNIVQACPTKNQPVLHYEITYNNQNTLNIFVFDNGECKYYEGDISHVADSIEYVYNENLFLAAMDSMYEVANIQEYSYLLKDIQSLMNNIELWEYESFPEAQCEDNFTMSKYVLTYDKHYKHYWHALMQIDKCGEPLTRLQGKDATIIHELMDKIYNVTMHYNYYTDYQPEY